MGVGLVLAALSGGTCAVLTPCVKKGFFLCMVCTVTAGGSQQWLPDSISPCKGLPHPTTCSFDDRSTTFYLQFVDKGLLPGPLHTLLVPGHIMVCAVDCAVVLLACGPVVAGI